MNYVPPRGVSMVCRFFVMSGVVMLGGFPVVAGGMREMVGCLLVVFGSFLRHEIFSKAFGSFKLNLKTAESRRWGTTCFC
jgi:hypothetical protein